MLRCCVAAREVAVLSCRLPRMLRAVSRAAEQRGAESGAPSADGGADWLFCQARLGAPMCTPAVLLREKGQRRSLRCWLAQRLSINGGLLSGRVPRIEGRRSLDSPAPLTASALLPATVSLPRLCCAQPPMLTDCSHVSDMSSTRPGVCQRVPGWRQPGSVAMAGCPVDAVIIVSTASSSTTSGHVARCCANEWASRQVMARPRWVARQKHVASCRGRTNRAQTSPSSEPSNCFRAVQVRPRHRCVSLVLAFR